MKRIGILGGTFNPVHIGHLAIAQIACDQTGLDKVLFIPSYYPPHKGRQYIISAEHRYNMVRSAIKDNPRFEANDFEIKRPGKSYSIDTLEYLHRVYPAGTKFFFIIGSDMVADLGKWKRIKELMKLVRFIVVTRKGYEKIKPASNVKIITLDLGISSSYLRRALAKKASVRYLVPDNVLAYIKKHHLYQS